MRSCNWNCRSGLPTKDAVLARREAWRDRAQTAPSMRSATVSEEKRWIMGQHRGLCAPSLTSSDALLKESFDNRQRPPATPSARTRQFTLALKDVDDSRISVPSLGLIRFGGHLPKGGYDVQTDGRHDEEPASPPAV